MLKPVGGLTDRHRRYVDNRPVPNRYGNAFRFEMNMGSAAVEELHATVEGRDAQMSGGRMAAGMLDAYARLDELLAGLQGTAPTKR